MAQPAPQPGRIVILNGAPRSGKSTIVGEMQARLDGIWMNFGVDRLMECTPAPYRPGIGLRPGGERPDLEPVVVMLYRALYDSVAAHCRQGLNVVVDVGHHDAYSTSRKILPDCAARLRGLPVLFVGVMCPLATVLARRQETDLHGGSTAVSASLPIVERWQREVHRPGIYDLVVDTSVLSAAECVNAIRSSLQESAAHSAFQLAAEAVLRRPADVSAE